MATVLVGVSLKMYFGHARANEWFARVADQVATHPATRGGRVEVFVVPTYLQILPALRAFAGTGVRVGAQDVAAADAGPYTGEVSAAELAEVGVTIAEIGHAERRRLFGEDDTTTATKAAAAVRHGLTPVMCVGETMRLAAEDAATSTVEQLRASLDGVPAGPVIVAYEPVWAIGAPRPAPAAHIRTVTVTLRSALDALPGRARSAVIYGGSAGSGLLARLRPAVDGLFLGRSAHDPDGLIAVLDEL